MGNWISLLWLVGKSGIMSCLPRSNETRRSINPRGFRPCGVQLFWIKVAGKIIQPGRAEVALRVGIRRHDRNRKGKMTKSISITSIVALLFLSGCSGYETLAQDSEIDGYTVQGLNWSSGRTTLVFLKAFDHQDKLAICSAYTGSGHGDPYSRIDRRLFDTANIYIGEERIGPMSFSNTVRQDKVKWHLADDQVVVTEFEGSINCVGTDREWKDSYRHSPIIFRGPNRIRIEI